MSRSKQCLIQITAKESEVITNWWYRAKIQPQTGNKTTVYSQSLEIDPCRITSLLSVNMVLLNPYIMHWVKEGSIFILIRVACALAK